MKNYIVKAIRNFNDTVEKNEYGLDTPRTAEVSIWNCTKERYEFLKQNNAVVLMGIEEIKINIDVEEPEIKGKKVLEYIEEQEKPKKTTKKKTSKK